MSNDDELPPLPKPQGPMAGTRKGAVDAKGKAIAKARAKANGAKRALQNAEKKIEALKKADKVLDGKPVIVSLDDLDLLPPRVREHVEDQPIIFKPNPGPQTEFLMANEREVLYGGAAGGGKSMGLLADAVRYAGHPQYRAILFRRTNDELRELIWKSKELYPAVFPGCKWSEQKSQWTFPSGATIWITYLDRDEDVLRYQGQSFCFVGFDETTNWPTPFPWMYMRSRLRTTAPDLPLFMRGTTNPGGVGSAWVRKLFVDAAPWGQRFPAIDIESGEPMLYPKGHAKEGQPLFYARFIPARLSDNPYLTRDGQYEANLLSLPEAQRRQLLEGDWDCAEGAAFPEWSRNIHVCKPFTIPDTWIKFRAADWGYTSPFCVLWFAVDPDQNLYVYREFYGKKLTADVFADKVLEMEAGDSIRYGVLDSSTWAQRGELGPPIAEQMILRGCSWRRADRSAGSRVAGKLELHRRLAVDKETGKPRLTVFDTCVNLIRTLPLLPVDKNKPEDINTDVEDHAYDALRYGIMSRPMNPHGYMDEFSSMMRPSFNPVDPVFGY